MQQPVTGTQAQCSIQINYERMPKNKESRNFTCMYLSAEIDSKHLFFGATTAVHAVSTVDSISTIRWQEWGHVINVQQSASIQPKTTKLENK